MKMILKKKRKKIKLIIIKINLLLADMVLLKNQVRIQFIREELMLLKQKKRRGIQL